MRSPLRWSSGLLGIVLGCCSRQPAPPDQKATAEARQAVLSAMAHYIDLIHAVSSDSVAAVYAEDGQLFEPGMVPLNGREAIRAFLAPFDGKAIVDTVTGTTDTLEIYGQTAYLWGHYHQVARLPDQPTSTFDGRYVARWRLEPGGQWKLSRLLMQPAPAADHASP